MKMLIEQEIEIQDLKKQLKDVNQKLHQSQVALNLLCSMKHNKESYRKFIKKHKLDLLEV